MTEVSVIIPARNAHSTLPRTLSALSRQRYDGDYEVIVVDDGSRDDTAALARAAPGPVVVVQQPPRGPAAARNLGVDHARAARLAFCDADVFPAPGWLKGGTEALESADIVQGKVLPDPDARLGPFDRTIWITLAVGLFETANLFVGRGTFDRVGGFQEWIRPRSGKALAEDLWFGYRALRAGARPAFCPAALAHHAVFARSWRGYIRERDRLHYFPAMARQAPELRHAFLHRRVFLNPRSQQFDLALAALALALGTGSPLPLPAALPYLRSLRRHARRAGASGPAPPLVALADAGADLVGLLALAGGGIRYRSLVI